MNEPRYKTLNLTPERHKKLDELALQMTIDTKSLIKKSDVFNLIVDKITLDCLKQMRN